MTTGTATQIIEGDWMERDNFPTFEQAKEYAAYLSKKYPVTPYRIVKRSDLTVAIYGPKATDWDGEGERFVVEFIIVDDAR